MQTRSVSLCHGGQLGYYRHASSSTGTEMGFAVFVPPQAAQAPVPALYFLAGLTCTEETFTIDAIKSAKDELEKSAHKLAEVMYKKAQAAAKRQEFQRQKRRKTLVRGAIHDGADAAVLRPWFTDVVSDHVLSYGHGAIYAQKAFQLLEPRPSDMSPSIGSAPTLRAIMIPSAAWWGARRSARASSCTAPSPAPGRGTGPTRRSSAG